MTLVYDDASVDGGRDARDGAPGPARGGARGAARGPREGVREGVREGTAAQPWRTVPVQEAVWMREHLPAVQERMVAGVLGEVPEYARPGDPVYRQVVEAAVAFAMEHLVRLIEDPGTSWKEVYQVYFDVGYGEAVEGRSLEHLQNAMRIASRTAWRYLAAEYQRMGRPLSLLSVMAEANFAYLDELSSAAASGYRRAREKAAGEREQRRHRLMGLLLSETPVPDGVVAEQAAMAGWALPQRLAAVVLRPRPGSGGEGPSGLPPEVLAGLDGGRPCLVVPDPDGPRQAERLAGMLAGWTGAVGPAVPPGEARVSLHWARRALDLPDAPETAEGRAEGRGEGGGRSRGRLVRAEDHVADLLLEEGGRLTEIVAARRLEPLTRTRSRHGVRLAVTLLECLKNGFNATGAAAALHVHPQTVRYRLGQLHDLLGFDIEDPEIRLELMLLLRVWIRRGGDLPE
ncbi:PucR family transcriptional regulator [Actinomadura atramentaria]|uniref:PucR family transcriptional regulator n=1 Tax=Actinomadura atramentaria TaxID=1990 RepID=UPI001F0A1E20|nr:helix-turn-helix domain-containing protein [Actinomadura atramentaria]